MIRPHGRHLEKLPTLRSCNANHGGIHRQGHRPRRAVWSPVRGVDGLPRPARGPDGQRVDPDRRAGDLGAQETRRLDDSREQHRPDHRLGRRIGGRRRGVHHPGADLPRCRMAPRYFNYTQITDAVVCRRHSRRVDDGAAAPRPDRQGARPAALPRRHRVRGSAGGRRARRPARGAGVQRPRHRRAVEVAVVDVQHLPPGDRPLAVAHRASFPTPR